MWKRIAVAGTAAALLAGLGVAGAAPASAGTSHSIYIYNSADVLVADGYFADYGEHFYACDDYKDGRGAQVDWYVVSDPGHHGSVRDVNGANGDCATQDASIAEGLAVNWRLCLTDAGTEVFCTGYRTDYA